MEPSHSQTTNKTRKPKVTSFFPLQKLKGTQPTKTPAIRAVHLEEEGSEEEAGTKSEDPDGIEGVTEEFIVCLARAVKETQKDEKWCYHCSSTDHFIRECLLVKASRSATHLNQKEGQHWRREPRQLKSGQPSQKCPRKGSPKCRKLHTDSFLESQPLSLLVGVENIAKVRISRESCMALLDNSVQINTIMPNFIEECSLNVGPLSDLVGR